MAILVKIIDEENNTRSIIGQIDDLDLLEFIDVSEKLNFKCLSFLDVVGDTYFNEKQQLQIKNELSILENKQNVNKEILKLIKRGVSEGLSECFLYLKFEGE